VRKIVKKLNKLAAEYLESGESIISGVRVNLTGTAAGGGFSALGGIGFFVGSKVMREGQEQAEDSRIVFSQQMALGLTNRRIIVWRRSADSGNAEEIIGQIPLSQLNDVEFEYGNFEDKLCLKFDYGLELELESIKIDKGKDFAGELKKSLTQLKLIF